MSALTLAALLALAAQLALLSVVQSAPSRSDGNPACPASCGRETVCVYGRESMRRRERELRYVAAERTLSSSVFALRSSSSRAELP